MPKRTVVPTELRKQNQVDQLLGEVEKIQKSCRHDFRLPDHVRLPRSKVKRVYIFPWDDGAPVHCDKVICLRCSKTKKILISETCPRCLGKMARLPRAEKQERYFDDSVLHCIARRYQCTACDFVGVAQERKLD